MLGLDWGECMMTALDANVFSLGCCLSWSMVSVRVVAVGREYEAPDQ